MLTTTFCQYFESDIKQNNILYSLKNILKCVETNIYGSRFNFHFSSSHTALEDTLEPDFYLPAVAHK